VPEWAAGMRQRGELGERVDPGVVANAGRRSLNGL
jgi:hypothetical protein